MDWSQLLSPIRRGDKKVAATHTQRSIFEADYDRIIFSHPFRRLQDKTQVIPLPVEDFVHTRLTHSLEVSSTGRSLGKEVGAVLMSRHPELAKQNLTHHDFGAIVATASLTHDLGNPPFGHAGEDAISDYYKSSKWSEEWKQALTSKQWEDLTHFEGNAQGFRLFNNTNQGLRLSYACLAAFSKYPRESGLSDVDSVRKSQKKYGFYQSEKNVFKEVAETLGLISLSEKEAAWCRHPLAFLVEAADDICYHIIDLEDGCRLGWVSLEETIELLAAVIPDRFDRAKLDRMSSPDEKVGLLRAMAIGKLVEETVSVFLDLENKILDGSFDKGLTKLIPQKDTLKAIQSISIEKIYRAKPVLEIEATGFEVIDGLLEVFTSALYTKFYRPDLFNRREQTHLRLFPQDLMDQLGDKPSEYEVLLTCSDFIAGMTDKHALNLFRKIKGISL